MNPVQRPLRALDRLQQSHRGLAVPFAVVKKYGDDQGGNLAALISFYGVFSLFPLLLVFVSIIGLLLQGNPQLQQSITDSALSNFPVIGTDIARNIHTISGSGAALVIGIVGTLWGGLGVTQAAQTAMNTVWGVPRKDWPNFVFSRVRGVLLLALLGTIVVLSTFAGGFGASGGTDSVLGVFVRIVGVLMSLLLNFALYLLAFRILTVAKVSWTDILPGAILAAVLWTALQLFGGYIVTHQLQGASNVYGTFAIVIGLMVWISLGAQITLYCAELNVVRVRKLWPRSLVQPPLSEADEQVYAEAAKAEARRPEQRVDVEFDPSATEGRPGTGSPAA